MKKSEKTKQLILHTAIELFKKNGIQKTSVDEMVKHSKIAKGTFFYYYSKKDLIVFEIIDREFNAYFDTSDKIIENTAMNAVEKMQEVLRSLFSSFQSPSVLQQIFKLGIDAQFQNHINEIRLGKIIPIITQIIEQGNEEGIFNVSYVSIISSIVSRGITSHIHSIFKNLQHQEVLNELLSGIEEMVNNTIKTNIPINITSK